MIDTIALASFVEKIEYGQMPENVIASAKIRVIDTIGCALFAKDNPLAKAIEKDYLELSNSDSSISIWGCNKKTSLHIGVMINALRCHLAELDDVHTESKTHIGSVVVPAAWGLAEKLGLSGKKLIEAVVCGYEIEARIAMSLDVINHREQGWHVSGTAGVFGAAAACCKLLSLDKKHIISAFGIAGTQSAGLWSFLESGATCKGMNIARAAVCGMDAALMAKAGMTGPENVLSADDGGLFSAMTKDPHPEALSYKLGDTYEINRVDVKPYASCRSTHGTIDAIKKIAVQEGFDNNCIEKIDVYTYLVGFMQCGSTMTSRFPNNGYEAKFSIPYIAASTIIRGDITPNAFEDLAVKEEEVREMLTKVNVFEDPKLTKCFPQQWATRVEILSSGKWFVATVKNAKGSFRESMAIEDIKMKISGLIGREKADEIIDVVQIIEKKPKTPAI